MQITKIRNKLLLVLIPLFLISFSALLSISFYLSQRALDRETQELATSIADQYSTTVEREISWHMTHLESMAATNILKSLDENSILAYMKAEQKRVPGYTTIFFINLKDPARNYGITSAGRHFDYNTRSYTKEILRDKKSYVSDPSVSATTGQLSVMLVTPVFNNNVMEGFIGGTVPLDELNNIVANIKFKDSGYGVIADRNGLIIANAKKAEMVGKTYMKDTPVGTKYQPVLDQGHDISVTYNADGVDIRALMAPINHAGNRWVMAIAVPESEINAEANQLGGVMLIISIISLIVTVIVIFIFAKRISDPLEMILEEYTILNNGDLRPRDIKINSADEIGKLAQGFVKMRATLASLISKTQAQAELVAATSEELTASANQSAEASEHVAISISDIAEGADKQLGESEASSQAATDMLSSSKMIAKKADGVKTIVNTTNKEVDLGRGEIAKVVVQMNTIEQGANNVEKSINELAKCSKEISSMVELISNIAGQTNLLALNAAIEAARAGEHGKGFAVVAEEVRKLAEESNQASQRIAELVSRNEKDMDTAINATKASGEGVRLGLNAVNSADGTFKNIVNAIEKLSTEISDISNAIEQMVSDSTAVSASIENINDISKSNAAGCQSVSAATEEQAASMKEISQASISLAKLAAELQEEVVKFKV